MGNIKSPATNPTPARLIPRRVEIIHEPAPAEIKAQQVQVVAEMFARQFRDPDSPAGDKPVTENATGEQATGK